MLQKKRKILFINQSSGYLMLDICNAFTDCCKYDLVALQTGEVNIRPTSPHPDLKVIKTKRYNKNTIVSRVLSWVVSFIHSLYLIWFKFPKAELFLVTNPPINLFLPLFCRNRYSILVFDIHPDTLIGQNVLKERSLIAKLWKKVNRKVMYKATNVYTISEAMKTVLTNYVSHEKIEVIDNWAHNEYYCPIEKRKNPFLCSLQIEDKFIVQYSGNMGYTHDIDVLVDVAAILRERQDIVFLLIGDGAKRRHILEKIKKLGLKNCYLLPFQPAGMLPYSMGAADVGIITLDSNSASLSIPSKTLNYMAIGAALLCVTPKGSQLEQLVQVNLSGEAFEKNQIQEIGEYIISLADDKDKANLLKHNALLSSEKYTPSNAYKYVK